jgi:hypothetical protein
MEDALVPHRVCEVQRVLEFLCLDVFGERAVAIEAPVVGHSEHRVPDALSERIDTKRVLGTGAVRVLLRKRDEHAHDFVRVLGIVDAQFLGPVFAIQSELTVHRLDWIGHAVELAHE